MDAPFRYTAALAGEHRASPLAGPLGGRGTFEAPNPAGPLADPGAVAGRPKLFLLDMFPYPSGAGLHVGHPLGYIGTDVYGRYRRMKGFNVLTPWATTPSACPPSSTPSRPAPTPGPHRENVANYRRQLAPARPGPRRPAVDLHDRRELLPLDPVDLPEDLRVLVRP